MKKTYNVLNMLLNFIGKNKTINESEKIKLLVKAFFTKEDNKEIPEYNTLNITDVSIDESDENKVSISIKLLEPGLLVGRNGNTIRQLGGFISKIIDKKTRIYVKDNEFSDYEKNTFI